MALPIRVRLTLVYTGLLFFALVASGTGVVMMLRRRLDARLEAALAGRLTGIEQFLRQETRPETAHHIPHELAEYASTQPDGRLLEVAEAEGGRVLLAGETVPEGYHVRTREFTLYGRRYRVRGAVSPESVDGPVEEIAWLLLGSTPLLLVLIGLSGYWLSSRTLRPVDAMTRAARSIGASDLSGRLLVPEGKDELSRLATAWNEMLARLEESFHRMERFTADAAHELRTPLASLRTTAEVALRRPREGEEYRQALRQVVEIAERMQGLADTLLAMARGQGPKVAFGARRVEVGALVMELSAEMEPLLADRGLVLERKIGRAWAEVDADGIRRAVAVLLDNAMKYTPSGGRVTVAVTELAETVEIRVSDTGVGIAAGERERIFERFYRVDPARATGGAGLGLAIARQIAEAHNGTLTVESEPGRGSSFALLAPRFRAA